MNDNSLQICPPNLCPSRSTACNVRGGRHVAEGGAWRRAPKIDDGRRNSPARSALPCRRPIPVPSQAAAGGGGGWKQSPCPITEWKNYFAFSTMARRLIQHPQPFPSHLCVKRCCDGPPLSRTLPLAGPSLRHMAYTRRFSCTVSRSTSSVLSAPTASIQRKPSCSL